jgi:hypothetical protein
LPTALWSPAPSADFHRTARRFAENLATAAAVAIDTGVYDKVRAFRAPNSTHPKTGRHKRRLTFDELLGPLDAILELAKTPAPFTVPTVMKTSEQAAADWQVAAALVASEGEAKAARRAAGNGSPTLNRSTLAFIREGAGTGDRHRMLFSAAANLAEFGCTPALAVALLEESGLDSGLAPKEVFRQIDCGLRAAAGTAPPQQAAGESPPMGPNGWIVQEPPEAAISDPGGLAGQSCQQVTGAPSDSVVVSGSQQLAGQSCQQVTGAPAAGDLQAALARLWGSTPAPKADQGKAAPVITAAARAVLPPDPPPLRSQPPKPAGPIPPIGAKLYFVNQKMQPCSPADCYCWTWEGAARWVHASEFSPPAAAKKGV